MLFHAHHFRTALLLFIGCMLASSLPAQGQVIPLKNWAAPLLLAVAAGRAGEGGPPALQPGNRRCRSKDVIARPRHYALTTASRSSSIRVMRSLARPSPYGL